MAAEAGKRNSLILSLPKQGEANSVILCAAP